MGDRVEELIANMRSNNWHVRRDAAEELGKIGDARAVEVLITKLNDGFDVWAVRASAAAALGGIGDVRAVESLITVLRDSDSDAYIHAAEALGQIGDVRAMEPLISALRHSDSDPHVRQRIARALERIDPTWRQSEAAKHIVPELIGALGAENWRVRLAAIKAIALIKPPVAVKSLITMTCDTNRHVRKASVEALSSIAPDWVHSEAAKQQIPTIITALRNKQSSVRRAATDMLYKISPGWSQSEAAKSQVPEFTATLSDKDWSVGESAAEVLGYIGDIRAVKPLIEVLGVWGEIERKVAVDALVRIGTPALESLIVALRDIREPVSEAVSCALFQIDPDWTHSEAAKRQVPDFIAALRHWHNCVRKTAVEALDMIASDWPQSGVAKQQIPEFIEALLNNDADVRNAAAEVLEKIDPTWPQSEVAKRYVPNFIAAIRENNVVLRKAAAEVLSKIGDVGAMETLVVLLRYPVDDVRKTAIEVLGKISTDRSHREAARQLLPNFIAAVSDGDEYVRNTAVAILDKIEPDWPRSEVAKRQVPEFLSMLRAVDWRMRQNASEVLGKIGDARAEEPLIALLRDKEREVRKAAAEALAKIKIDWSQSEAAIRQLPDFIAALGGSSYGDVRVSALGVVVEIGLAAVEPLIKALHDDDWRVQEAAVCALGKIGDSKALKPLIATLHDDAWLPPTKYAIDAVAQIRTSNRSALLAFPRLVCKHCMLRPEMHKGKVSLLKTIKWVVCRGCGSSGKLLTDVRNVVGVIGGTTEGLRKEGRTVTINLWNEVEQSACNADIDSLVICAGGVNNYERAVNAVINALRGDVSRPVDWCKKIPVILEGSPELTPGARRMLEDTFAVVEART